MPQAKTLHHLNLLIPSQCWYSRINTGHYVSCIGKCSLVSDLCKSFQLPNDDDEIHNII